MIEIGRMKEEDMESFGEKIEQVLKGKNLTRKEAKNLFSQVLLGRQSEIHQGAFLAALTAKGPTPEEIVGSFEAIYELDTLKVKIETSQPLIDNCGTGMDAIKTFNVSTASAIVAAAGGVCLARHGSRAISSRCGTVDLAEAMGIDVECEVGVVKKSIERAGIGVFNGMSSKVHPQALFRILSQIRFGTILNIAASLANPALPRYGVRGVYSSDLVKPLVQVMKQIGYQRAMVFHGLNSEGSRGMDEISPLGETFIVELHESGEVSTYTIFPKDLGIKRRPQESDLLALSGPKKEALSLLKVLIGKDKGARYVTTCLNAAPIFYLTGKVNDLKEGVEMAKAIIDSGNGLSKLRQWVKEQNIDPQKGEEQLETLLREV